MARPLTYATGLLALLTIAACGDDPGDLAPPPVDIADRLRQVPGLAVAEVPTSRGGYRFFHLTYEQPADHAAPQGARFQQRLTLLHLRDDAPTVITTSGYFVSLRDNAAEITRRLGANQIAVEHRFFGPSRPEPADWRHLTIVQAAADHHRIITDFRPIYRGRWVSTGGSKGGLASVFHRRFYPDDVDGTVAYVAPVIPMVPDQRYGPFIEEIGRRTPEDPQCGSKLDDVQRRLLTRRPALDQRAAALPGLAFSLLTVPIAVEHAVLELPFFFWQYGDASLCPRIPPAGAGDDDLFGFLNQVHPLSDFADEDVVAFRPYYYQSGTEEGYPTLREDHVVDLLEAPGTYVPQTYLPQELMVTFDPRVMTDIAGWVRTQARGILFIYGENNPWTAAAFDLGPDAAERGIVRLDVSRGNHGARIAQLGEADRLRAEELLRRFAGVEALQPLTFAATAGPPEEEEPRRRIR